MSMPNAMSKKTQNTAPKEDFQDHHTSDSTPACLACRSNMPSTLCLIHLGVRGIFH